MHFLKAHLAVLGALPLLSLAAPSAFHVVHEKRDASPEWIKGEPIAPETLIPFRIGLVQSNLDRGHNILMDIADPSSPNYARHMDAQDVVEFFAPAEDTVRETKEWVAGSGISHSRIVHTANRGWLRFVASAKELEELLHTRFHKYAHAETGEESVACDEYQLPAHLTKHVDFVTPGVKLSSRPTSTQHGSPSKLLKKRQQLGSTLTPKEVKALNLSTCDKVITPECIRALYKIPANDGAPQATDGLGIFGVNATYLQSDLDLFFANAYPAIPPGTQTRTVLLNGAKVLRKPDEDSADFIAESDGDVQVAWPLLYPQNITLLTANVDLSPDAEAILDGDNATASMEAQVGVLTQGLDTTLEALDGSYCEWTNANRSSTVCGTVAPPAVLSLSVGASETLLPAREQFRLCLEFLKLGLRGTSVVVASGDSGVASRPAEPGPGFCAGPQRKLFTPSYLSACPYVTAVGATAVLPGQAVTDPESAALEVRTSPDGGEKIVRLASGGGFSNRLPAPWYQKDAVTTYLRDNPPPFASYNVSEGETVGARGGVFNRGGRAFPDVSAVGDHILAAQLGSFRVGGGTSASAPIFASILTRINGERAATGKRSLGFVNPVLYQNAAAFNDVVNGTNPGCGTVGFKAAAGWDPVTGLGTPDYGKLKDLFMALP